MDNLGVAEQEKIVKFHRYEDQQASLLGKMLLMRGLVKFGYEKELLKEIVYTEYKRPYINVPLDFNISHSGDLIACALSNSGKIGIDVEKIRPVKLEDFKDIFSADEYKSILQSENPSLNFYNTWARKEAVVKANGMGLYIPLNEFIVDSNTVVLQNHNWYLEDISLSENYSSFIATDYLPGDDLVIRYVTNNELVLC